MTKFRTYRKRDENSKRQVFASSGEYYSELLTIFDKEERYREIVMAITCSLNLRYGYYYAGHVLFYLFFYF